MSSSSLSPLGSSCSSSSSLPPPATSRSIHPLNDRLTRRRASCSRHVQQNKKRKETKRNEKHIQAKKNKSETRFFYFSLFKKRKKRKKGGGEGQIASLVCVSKGTQNTKAKQPNDRPICTKQRHVYVSTSRHIIQRHAVSYHTTLYTSYVSHGNHKMPCHTSS